MEEKKSQLCPDRCPSSSMSRWSSKFRHGYDSLLLAVGLQASVVTSEDGQFAREAVNAVYATFGAMQSLMKEQQQMQQSPPGRGVSSPVLVEDKRGVMVAGPITPEAVDLVRMHASRWESQLRSLANVRSGCCGTPLCC